MVREEKEWGSQFLLFGSVVKDGDRWEREEIKRRRKTKWAMKRKEPKLAS